MRSDKAEVRVMTPKRAEGTIASLMEKVLTELGEDPAREGLVRTPARSEAALRFLTSGYHMDLRRVINGALFSVKYDEMVIVKDIEFFSLCEHHLLPFFGRMHVAYLPNDKVIGIEQIPRVVDMFARRLQCAGSELTRQVAEAIQEVLRAEGRGASSARRGTSA